MLLINHVFVITMDHGKEYKDGFVLLDTDSPQGRILAVGEGDGTRERDEYCSKNGKDSAACRTLDGKNGILIPGMIDPHCHIGLWEDGQRDEDGDGNEETDPCTPQMRAIDAVNPFDPCFREAAEGGITSVMTGPGSANVIGGQFAFMKTAGTTVEEMLVKSPAAMKVAFGENPKSVYGKRNTAPGTRMGTAAVLREALFKARHYQETKGKAAANPEKEEPEYSIKNETMLQVLDGTLPLKIHAHRADDLLTAIRICREFELNYTLDHCTEGYRITKTLSDEYQAGRLIGVLTGPLLSDRSKPELAHSSIQNPGILSGEGICTGIMTDHPVIPIQYLPISAAVAVREGMDETKALEAITINAAKLCGVQDRVGSLETGKDGDLVILTGHPFEFKSKIRCTVINGKIVYQSKE